MHESESSLLQCTSPNHADCKIALLDGNQGLTFGSSPKGHRVWLALFKGKVGTEGKSETQVSLSLGSSIVWWLGCPVVHEEWQSLLLRENKILDLKNLPSKVFWRCWDFFCFVLIFLFCFVFNLSKHVHAKAIAIWWSRIFQSVPTLQPQLSPNLVG